MAWLSIATNNDDLVDKLQDHRVFRSDDPAHARIIQAFRDTDRGDFVPQEHRYANLLLINYH